MIHIAGFQCLTFLVLVIFSCSPRKEQYVSHILGITNLTFFILVIFCCSIGKEQYMIRILGILNLTFLVLVIFCCSIGKQQYVENARRQLNVRPSTTHLSVVWCLCIGCQGYGSCTVPSWWSSRRSQGQER